MNISNIHSGYQSEIVKRALILFIDVAYKHILE